MHAEVPTQTVFSGVQPSGEITLGHLTGALRNWVSLQQSYNCIFCVVDLHAITVRQKPADLRKRVLDTAAMFIAAGVDPAKSTVFVQSHVSAHAELAWTLSTFAAFGELSRMTQFKDKSKQHEDNVNAGLFSYPVLMAADILLYKTNLVPVGDDQKQHLELTRDIAQRFNNIYGEVLTVPEPLIASTGARIMSLQDPLKKMSKSDPNHSSTIFLTDSDDQIKNKIKRAVTDSGSDIRYDTRRPGISNLLEIYHIASGLSLIDSEKQFEGKGYGEFKSAVADACVAYIKPVRERFSELRADTEYLISLLQSGADNARTIAGRTLTRVYRKIGFA